MKLILTMMALLVSTTSAAQSFSLKEYQWSKRVLVLSSSTQDEARLNQQLAQVELFADDFADRDMVLITLLDDGVSTADQRELSAEETAAVRSALGIQADTFAVRLIGKDGGVKLSNNTVTAMNDVYALIDTMPMRRREISNNSQ